MFLLVLMSVCGLSFTSCSDKKEEKEEQIKLLVTSPLAKDTTITKEYVAQIHAYQHIDLRALEKGYLQKIFVDEGQTVHKGQPMFQITPLIYNADLQKSQAEASYVGIDDKAKADVSLAKTHLQFTSISAPFTGIMDHFQARLGSLVDEGDLLTSISDNSKMWVYYNVPEAEYIAYKQHAKAGDKEVSVNLKMANNEVFPHPGKVQTIEADFNNETGNIAFRATFPNPEGLLRNGETGSVLMTVPLKHALIIPQKATFEVLEKKFVYVVDKNSVVHQKEVNVASEMPELYIIKDGIAPTDKILLEGIRKVKDGEKISYTYEAPEKVLPKLRVYSE
jgi:membrane fusion protein (multidrug efflux system)